MLLTKHKTGPQVFSIFCILFFLLLLYLRGNEPDVAIERPIKCPIAVVMVVVVVIIVVGGGVAVKDSRLAGSARTAVFSQHR